MSLLDQVNPTLRKILTFFYIVDSSGSMNGDKIKSVNSAIKEAITIDLPDISMANDDAEIRVAIMQFSSGCSWITPASGPVGIGDIVWKDLQANGSADLGAACIELDKKLSGYQLQESQTDVYAPVIILFSDGGHTDDWKRGLAQLKKNNWFKRAIKFAIAIGEDADRAVLAEFTGSPETVLNDLISEEHLNKNYEITIRDLREDSTTAHNETIAYKSSTSRSQKEQQPVSNGSQHHWNGLKTYSEYMKSLDKLYIKKGKIALTDAEIQNFISNNKIDFAFGVM